MQHARVSHPPPRLKALCHPPIRCTNGEMRSGPEKVRRPLMIERKEKKNKATSGKGNTFGHLFHVVDLHTCLPTLSRSLQRVGKSFLCKLGLVLGTSDASTGIWIGVFSTLK